MHLHLGLLNEAGLLNDVTSDYSAIVDYSYDFVATTLIFRARDCEEGRDRQRAHQAPGGKFQNLNRSTFPVLKCNRLNQPNSFEL